jgi:hypothetical protein
VAKHGFARFFGLSARFKGRAANPDGAPVLIDRSPRRHKNMWVTSSKAAALSIHYQKAGSE